MARRGFKDYKKGATPAGTFVYPKINEPDHRFAHEFGEFSVHLDLSGQAAEDLKKVIDEQLEFEYAHECAEKGEELLRSQYLPYGQATEGKEKTPIEGVTRFKFKRKAGGRYGPKHAKAGETWKGSFPIFAASGTSLVEETVWGGTIGRVSYLIVPWFTPSLGFGVRLQIEAVKIIKLVTQGERAPEEYGFEDEAGYAVPANTATEEHFEDTPDEDEGVNF
jgi:hypothetical protein